MKQEYKLGIALLILITITSSIAQETQTIQLEEGKNTFTIEQFFYPTYASILIKEHPQIQTITLKQETESKGYVNTLGGIGKDFIIEQGKTYEIRVSEALNVTLR